MTIADLVAKLSLKSNKASFAAGEKLLGHVRTAIAGIAAFSTVKWFGSLVHDTLEASGKLVDLSDALGVAIEPLQELGYAAEQSGSSVEEMGAGLKRLGMSAAAAAKGNKEARAAFKGIDYKDAAGRLLPIEQILGGVADKLAAMPEGAERTNLAMKLLGKGGAGLIPALSGGSKGLAEMRAQLIRMGGEIDGGTARAFDDFGDKIGLLSKAWQGLKVTLTAALLPIMTRVIDRATAWWQANQLLVREQLISFVERLAKRAGELWAMVRGLWPTLKAWADTTQALIRFVGGAENAVRLMIGAWIAFKGLQVTALIVGVTAKLWALATASKAVAASTGGAGGAVQGLATAAGAAGKGAAARHTFQEFADLEGGAAGAAGAAGKAGRLARARGALSKGAGTAGLLLEAGMAGYGIGTWIDSKTHLSDKISGAEGDYLDPRMVAGKKRNAQRKLLASQGREILGTLNESILGGAAAKLPPAPGRMASPTFNAAFNISAAPGMSEEQLAKQISKEMRAFTEAQARALAAGGA